MDEKLSYAHKDTHNPNNPYPDFGVNTKESGF